MTKPVDREGGARAVAALLEALGYDPRTPELAGTPERVMDAFSNELLAGRAVDLRTLVQEGSEPARTQGDEGVVVVRGIHTVTICPHHLLPGVGTAIVAYLPGRRLLGLGTIARVVDACARRLTLQEEIGDRVVHALVEHAGARGAYCQIELLHTCFVARGEKQAEGRLVTVARSGEFTRPETLAELTLALSTGRAG